MQTMTLEMPHLDHNPVALIFSDSIEGTEAAIASARAAGARIGATVDIEGAVARLANQVMADAIIVDVTRSHGTTLDRLLDQVDAWTARNGVPAIYSAPMAMIDEVASHMDNRHVTLLCEPDSFDRAEALATVLAKPATMLNDVSTELDNIRVKRIADEVSRLGRSLARLAAGGLSPADDEVTAASGVNAMRLEYSAEPMAAPTTAVIDPSDVRTIIRLRRMRNAYFSGELFADPAWDMLLDLTAAQLEGERVAVSSLCIAAAVPATTALRWIKTMCDHGLFERHADPLDGRRIFIALSTMTANAMLAYLSEAKRVGGLRI